MTQAHSNDDTERKVSCVVTTCPATIIQTNRTVCKHTCAHTQVAALGVPYVLMHMRGDPATMSSPPHTHYDCVWREVGQELQAGVDAAVQAGVPAWSILCDPGVLLIVKAVKVK